MHTAPMSDSEGEFNAWKKCEHTVCRKCKSGDVKYREWESNCGGYEDYNYECQSCGHSWWVDGIDS